MTLCSATATSCPEPPPCSASPTLASDGATVISNGWSVAWPAHAAGTHTHTHTHTSFHLFFFFLFPVTPLDLWDLHSPTRD